MRLSDATYQRVFERLSVYNILFEDSEVDERFFGVDSGSRVLTITGAGCRVAGHLSSHPARIDAVDINPHHLALAALKVNAARRLRSYDQFYALFGQGQCVDADKVLVRVVDGLPRWMHSHWRAKRSVFRRSLHRTGMAASLFRALQLLTGVDERWLRRLSTLSVAERQRVVDETFAPVLRNPVIAAAVASPVNLLALGINYAQCDRMLRAERTDMTGFLLNFLGRIAATDLSKNWFAWHAIAGRFNHHDPDGVPPYLRRDRHERSLEAPTSVRFHLRNIFDVLDEAPAKTWTHYALCDAPDWMNAGLQRKLLHSILRTSRDGGRVVYRSVEAGSMAKRLGLEKHFVLDEQASREAVATERTRIFHAVNYYRIVH